MMIAVHMMAPPSSLFVVRLALFIVGSFGWWLAMRAIRTDDAPCYHRPLQGFALALLLASITTAVIYASDGDLVYCWCCACKSVEQGSVIWWLWECFLC